MVNHRSFCAFSYTDFENHFVVGKALMGWQPRPEASNLGTGRKADTAPCSSGPTTLIRRQSFRAWWLPDAQSASGFPKRWRENARLPFITVRLVTPASCRYLPWVLRQWSPLSVTLSGEPWSLWVLSEHISAEASHRKLSHVNGLTFLCLQSGFINKDIQEGNWIMTESHGTMSWLCPVTCLPRSDGVFMFIWYRKKLLLVSSGVSCAYPIPPPF